MFTKTFKELSKKDVGIAGGKGASLGEMSGIGIPVPAGFVILAEAFDRFLEETDLGMEIVSLLKGINYKDLNSVDAASYKIRDLVSDVPMPEDLAKIFLSEYKKMKTKFVAVRSSATAEDSAIASWAGELETYLNTTEKNLMENVKKCWSSLFTQRALFYAFEKQVFSKKHQQKIRAGTSKMKDSYPVSVAVVVQKMIQSEISGVCFTVHPVTEDRNQMVIEAGFGLGEAIVSGQITPDTYVVAKRDWSLVDVNVSDQKRMIVKKSSRDGSLPVRQAGASGGKGEGVEWKPVERKKRNRQKLAGKQIVELAKLCDRLEKHYKHPQDIEWALEKGKFYITQSRPITTLS